MTTEQTRPTGHGWRHNGAHGGPLVLGALGELALAAWTTTLRYRNQGLDPVADFNIWRLPNLVALGTTAALVGLMGVAWARRDRLWPWQPWIILLLVVAEWALLIGPAGQPKAELARFYLPLLALKVFLVAYTWRVTRHGTGRSIWRNLFVSSEVAGLIAVLGLGVTFVTTYSYRPSTVAMLTGSRRADAAMILGAAVWRNNRPSPVLRNRLQRGYELWQRGAVPTLVLTGGASHQPGELAESVVMARELGQLGVPDSALVIEAQSTSTVEQMGFLRDTLLPRHGWRLVAVVSDRFHLRRVQEIARFNGLDGRIVGVGSQNPFNPTRETYYRLRETVALVLYWFFGL